MRTTLDLDVDVLSAARQFAAARSISLGKAVSVLVRRGLEPRAKTKAQGGFPVFDVPKNARPLTKEQVRRNEDDV
jgi:hypothetical protein